MSQAILLPPPLHETFWDSVLRLTTDKRFLIPTSMLPFSTIWLLVVAGRHATKESAVAQAAALATLKFALLWSVALTGLFLLWWAGAQVFLGLGVEVGVALALSGLVAGIAYVVAAVSLIVWSE